MKNIVQIMIEDYDYFGKDEFLYEVGFMEKKLHILEGDIITKYHISLEKLKEIDYNSIKYEKDALKRILYMFVCNEENLEEAYKGDTFMENVVKTAKEIAGKNGIPLFLSEAEVRRLDNEEAAIKEGYDAGYNTGALEKQTEMILNMYTKKYPIDVICDATNLSIDEIKKIIKDNE